MNNDGMKEVYFGLYCKTCEHYSKDQDQEPCNECLTEPMNQYSHKPVKWKAGNNREVD